MTSDLRPRRHSFAVLFRFCCCSSAHRALRRVYMQKQMQLIALPSLRDHGATCSCSPSISGPTVFKHICLPWPAPAKALQGGWQRLVTSIPGMSSAGGRLFDFSRSRQVRTRWERSSTRTIRPRSWQKKLSLGNAAKGTVDKNDWKAAAQRRKQVNSKTTTTTQHTQGVNKHMHERETFRFSAKIGLRASALTNTLVLVAL